MRAKRISPHRNNLIVRRTKCKNFCAADHANVSDIRSTRRGGARARPRTGFFSLDPAVFSAPEDGPD